MYTDGERERQEVGGWKSGLVSMEVPEEEKLDLPPSLFAKDAVLMG